MAVVGYIPYTREVHGRAFGRRRERDRWSRRRGCFLLESRECGFCVRRFVTVALAGCATLNRQDTHHHRRRRRRSRR